MSEGRGARDPRSGRLSAPARPLVPPEFGTTQGHSLEASRNGWQEGCCGAHLSSPSRIGAVR